jgi:thioesterase domain-containing protein
MDLARDMGKSRPFYALQSPVPDPLTRNFLSTEQMATLYIDEIRKVQPVGPYRLGGWSMGGVIAFEMSKQLATQGDATELIAMIDTHPPTVVKQQETSMLARFAGDIGRLLGKDLRQLTQRFLELGHEEQWQLLLDTLVREGVLAHETARQELTDMLNVFTQNSTAFESYSLQKTPQRVVLFRASQAENPEQLAEEWARWTGQKVELHLISGDHYSMMQEPNVSRLAGLLKACLEKPETVAAQ